ncbi:hypothetical protein AB0C07_09515 [Actinoplanes missouriensis]|uniref:hypothetical protein n=1 Tax=Actinoplanes missouriensis TaxID=1866 RepID=UPI0033F30534
MENDSHVPDPAEAREALATIDSAQRAVRDTPWPTWIYPVNALLLGAMTLTFALGDDGRTYLFATGAVLLAINVLAGYRMGTPYTLPTSRTFLALAFTAIGCLAAAFVVSEITTRSWPIIVLAVAATVLYLIAGVVHRRSTGAPR